MYNETQLAAIKLFGRKELTEGCVIEIPKTNIWSRRGKEGFGKVHTVIGELYISANLDNGNYLPRFLHKNRNIKIIGHIPHLEDLFRVAEDRGWIMQVGDTSGIHVGISIRDDKMKIKRALYKKSIPLLSQPNLSEIVNLFSK